MEVEFYVGVFRERFVSVTKCDSTIRPVFQKLIRF